MNKALWEKLQELSCIPKKEFGGRRGRRVNALAKAVLELWECDETGFVTDRVEKQLIKDLGITE